MSRSIKYTEEKVISDCIHCPYYDEVLSSTDMRRLYICTDPSSPKITDKKFELFNWFKDLCTFSEI